MSFSHGSHRNVSLVYSIRFLHEVHTSQGFYLQCILGKPSVADSNFCVSPFMSVSRTLDFSMIRGNLFTFMEELAVVKFPSVRSNTYIFREICSICVSLGEGSM